jgi:imidazolonepropionase-like amidohydrolase
MSERDASSRGRAGLALAALLLLGGGGAAAEQPPTARALLLRPERVWTAGSPAHAGWVVLVVGQNIAAAGPAASVAVPADAEVIDLPGETLTPGLMDLHSHLLLHPYNEASWNDQVLHEAPELRTLRAGKQAHATLMAGFTTLRDLGTEGAGYADVAVKHAIEQGIIDGPRLWVATRAIVALGSYGPAVREFRPDIDLPQGGQEASGVEGIVRAVREQSARGADWIKLYADYRAGPNGEGVPTFSEEELKAAVDTAHSLGRPVAVHTSTTEGMRRAIAAGADTIEHGYGGTAELFQEMAARHVAYMPTLTAPEATSEYFQHYKPGDPPTPGHGSGGPCVSSRPRQRGDDRLRQRRRRLCPRDQLARAGMDGARRHDPDPGAHRRHGDGRGRPRPGKGSGDHRAGRAGRPRRHAGRSDPGHRGDRAGELRHEGWRDLSAPG